MLNKFSKLHWYISDGYTNTLQYVHRNGIDTHDEQTRQSSHQSS